MHVGVYRLRGQADIQHAGRKTTGHHHTLVRPLHSHHGGLGPNVAIVDKEMLHGSVGPGILRLAYKAGYPDSAHLVFHRHQRGCKLLAKHRVDAGEHLSVAGSLQLGATVANELDRNLGVG